MDIYYLACLTNCEQIIPFVAGAKHVRLGHSRGSGYLLFVVCNVGKLVFSGYLTRTGDG